MTDKVRDRLRDAPPCFGCSWGATPKRRQNRAEYLVGDIQGHATVECVRHARQVLTRGGWAIPLASLCLVTTAEAIHGPEGADDVAPVDQRCPTYASGRTIER